MNFIGDRLPLLRRRRLGPAVLDLLLVPSPRLLVYCGCSLLMLAVSYHLGKEMAWDTRDYHLYAGYSALHDRFSQDYFAAGPQGYFNPYIFVPFYLLVNSGLSALHVASILAFTQSAILWLTYELATAVVPSGRSRVRFLLPICATALAFANPILINQVGTSFADVLTAEVVLLGWLLVVRAIHAPCVQCIIWAALVLGGASALKMTNAVHVISAGLLVLFVPVHWRAKLRYGIIFVLCVAVGFVVVNAPWSIRLEQHFGNPLFPLMNGFFRSPDFTTARIFDYRFIPVSLGAALWLPFAVIAPRSMIYVEWAAPDLRYALLLVVGVAAFLIWVVRRNRRGAKRQLPAANEFSTRVLAALGCAFLADWIIWITVSGNGRYFIPMACVAAVVAMGLIFRLCSHYPKARNYLLLAVFSVQLYQLHAGTEYPARLPWSGGPWFQVEVPKPLTTEASLYFNLGNQSNSFLAAYLAPGAGLVNLEGGYTLGSGGSSGRHIRALIRRYSPHMWILERDIRADAYRERQVSDTENLNDAIASFGLRVDSNRCMRIVVRGVPPPPIVTGASPTFANVQQPNTYDGYFIACRVVASTGPETALVSDKRSADLAFNHLEDACPQLLQPARPASFLRSDKAHGHVWVRVYGNTDIVAWIRGGRMFFQRIVDGGRQGYAGRESDWERAPLPVVCGRGNDGYFLRVLGSR